MSAVTAQLPGPPRGAHPLVASRRRRELGLLALAALLPIVVGLAISVATPNPSITLALGVVCGLVGVAALVLNTRLEVSVVILALYLGVLEGPVKLGSGGHATASVIRDVLIFSVCLGAILRLIASRGKVRLPEMSLWVLAWAALVVVEAFNPKTQGITKALGGFRQQLEWLPFFFFGYVLMRNKRRFRQLFLVLGVLALANGVISTYQTRLSPGQLATWGPGYRELVFGNEGSGGKLGGRTFASNGEGHVRPPALGTDAGFGGGVGALAIPAMLALLATGRLRRRWPVLLMAMGALAAVATGLGRLQVVGAVLSIIAFAMLSLSAGRRVTKPLIALVGVVVVAIPVGLVFVSLVGGNTFARYESFEPGNKAFGKDTKQTTLMAIPKQISQAPFGIGLGRVGAATGFGGRVVEEGNEAHNYSAETQYNFVTDELGLPGLLLWCALTIRLLTLIVTRLSRVPDVELRVYLAAVFATVIAQALMGLSGPTMASAAFGPFFWGAVGIAAYWLAKRPDPQAGERSESSPGGALAGVAA